MGLLLSILVFSVGVLEAFACVRRIQHGILPAWAPRHVTTSSGRRLLREHWRKSTSLDDGSADAAAPGRDGTVANGALARHRPAPLALADATHHPRSPDIHWPEPVPHSPIKILEQTLPSPVEEVPGDAQTWPSGDPAPARLQRRRTSSSETLPHHEQGRATPLRDATPEPSFAREGREPPRHKPAKASSFEEARVEPVPKAAEVLSLSYSDRSSAGPRAAVVGRISIKATKAGSEDDAPAPALWPIVHIDTVAATDEQGDVTPPPCVGSRRVSFDPVPTVVVIDKETPIAEERERGTVLAPSFRITDDLQGVLRKELPCVIDDILRQALSKANEVLESRRKGPLNGVSLIIESLVARSDKVLNGPMANARAEGFKDHLDRQQQQRKNEAPVISAIPTEHEIFHSTEERLQGVPSPAIERKDIVPNALKEGLQNDKDLQRLSESQSGLANKCQASTPEMETPSTLDIRLLPTDQQRSETVEEQSLRLKNGVPGKPFALAKSESAQISEIEEKTQQSSSR